MLINIAPLGRVYFSSTSKWSTNDDSTEILTSEHDRNFSFHTAEEDYPYVIIDLQRIYKIEQIRITNRFGSLYHIKARTLKIEGGITNSFSKTDLIYDSHENWGQLLELPVHGKDVRFIKLSLKECNYFHLKLIEIFVNSDDIPLFNTTIKNNLETLKRALSVIKKEVNCYSCDDNLNQIVFYNFIRQYYGWLPQIKYKLDNSKNGCPSFYLEFSPFDNNKYFNTYIHTICERYGLVYYYNYSTQVLCVKCAEKFSLEEQIELLLNKLFESFLPSYNALITNINYSNYIDDVHKPVVIIDVDKITSGFADRLRGALSIIECCNEIGLEYVVKFTKPFNFSKYYTYREFSELNLQQGSYCDLGKINLCSDLALQDILSSVKNYFDYITISSIAFNFTRKETFDTSFKKTSFFLNELNKYKSIIGDKYISISFRFVNSLGDFNDSSSFNLTLPDNEQIVLMEKCRNELIKFINDKKLKQKILVLSDSTKFLKYIKNITNVYVFEENIAHVSLINSSSDNSEKFFIKTLVDFNLIIDAQESFRFETEHMYGTNFPKLAARCAGRDLIVHRF